MASDAGRTIAVIMTVTDRDCQARDGDDQDRDGDSTMIIDN